MGKLSQRAWNNVIIVSMLILIMLFNFSGNFLNSGSDETSTTRNLVPSDKIITTMVFEQLKVERIGQGWRAISGERTIKYTNEKLVNLIENWVNAEISLIEQHNSWHSPSAAVELWFAGQALPTEYQFKQQQDQTLVKINQQTYQLISPSYQSLTPQE